MWFKATSTVPKILALVLSLLLVVLVAGCGGGGDQSGGSQKEGDSGGAKNDKLSRKVAIGTVRAYKDDRRRLSLRPTSEAQGDKPLGFKVRKKAQVTLDGEQAELGDIEEGQQAQIRYVVKNDVNRAIIVQLFSNQQSGEDRKKSGEDDDQDQPSGGDDNSG